MEKDTRNQIQRATQAARAVLEREYAEQLEGLFDIRLDGTIARGPGQHLDDAQRVLRTKLVAAVEHHQAGGLTAAEAVAAYLREAAFTMLNRFVALKMLEARGLVQECVSRGDQSSGFKEFTGLAPGAVQLPDHGYRLYIECLFDEIGREVRVLFDRRDPASLLWPRRQALLDLLAILNTQELAEVWKEDETIGWVYQYFNSDDERRQMRAESQAPRNSRELAVRNQFFTPRYVVEFLTDNTLGRTWYEMRQGKTRLEDECDYLVRRPSEIFLAEGEDAPNGNSADDELSQEELLKQPVYIPYRARKDPRDLKILDPACGSGHFLLYAFDLLVTIYEEAWGDEQSPSSEATGHTLREDYASLDDLRRALPGLLLRHNLHGIDIDPRAAQIAALALWMRAQRACNAFGIPRAERLPIRRTHIVVAEPMPGEPELRAEFIADLEDQLGQLVQRVFDAMELAGDAGSLIKIEEDIREAIQDVYGQHGDLFRLEDEAQWQSAEATLLLALERYAEHAGNGRAYRRRLFAENAAHGFAFIDLCQQRYDVVLMNPPFGEPSESARAYQKQRYSRSADNLAIAFLLRGRNLRNHRGRMGAITDCSWEVKYDYRHFRDQVIADVDIDQLVDLGWGVLDANVETSVSIFAQSDGVLVAKDASKDQDRLLALKSLKFRLPDCGYRVTQFAEMPNSIFAYSLPHSEYESYANRNYLTRTWFSAVAGVKSCDSSADFRTWWESPSEQLGAGKEWQLLHNGSPYCPFHYPALFSVRSSGGSFRLLMARGGALPGRAKYLELGCAYGKRTDDMYAYIKHNDECFSQEGQAIFPDKEISVWDVLALTNSRVYSRHANYVAGQHKYHRYLNLIALSLRPDVAVSEAARYAYETLLDLDRSNDVSPHFDGVNAGEFSLRHSASERQSQAEMRMKAVSEAHDRINAVFALTDDDREQIRKVDYYTNYFGIAYSEDLVREVWISWTLGQLFGRWKRDSCEPNPILVDDPGHINDISNLVSQTLVRLVDEQGLREIGLDTHARLTVEVRTELFTRHVRRYSRGRRKAPIYWQLATPSAGYSVWLYYHRFTPDTFYTVLNDYVAPKLHHEERKLGELTQETAGNPTASQRKEKEEQERFVEELLAFRDEVARIAPLWKPDLNDGVIINFAPLWRLVPQHRAWQKECRTCWDKLVAGDYDWAHLAMHLWPERVVPKCATDRSLAIAHGLEEEFWEEGKDGKWKARKVAPDKFERLIQERTSPAVKAALKSLLEAPAPEGGRGGGRPARAKRAPVARARSRQPRAEPAATAEQTSLLSGQNGDDHTEAVRQTIAARTEGASKADVLAATGLSDGQWNAAISALLEQGVVKRTGTKRGTRYHLD